MKVCKLRRAGYLLCAFIPLSLFSVQHTSAVDRPADVRLFSPNSLATVPEPTNLKNQQAAIELARGRQSLTYMAQTARPGEQDVDAYGYHDYSGGKVVAARLWDDDLGLGIATELGKNEAYEGLRTSQHFIVLFTLLSMLLLFGLKVILIVCRERKRAEDDLRSSQSELQFLSKELILAQESERKRIAAELHDGIGQSLSAIKIGVENAQQGMADDMPQLDKKTLMGIIDKLRDAIEEVRRISMDLRPPMLDDLGLLPTINWFCREFQSLFPKVVFNKRVDVAEREISECKKIVIFRIIQEALNNIAKHAKAHTISIELANSGDMLLLRIKDDGRGFVEKCPSKAQGFGLSSMKERTRLSGGKLTINSMLDAGTDIQVVWPMRDNALKSADHVVSQTTRTFSTSPSI